MKLAKDTCDGCGRDVRVDDSIDFDEILCDVCGCEMADCGAPKADGEAYCAAHGAEMYARHAALDEVKRAFVLGRKR